MSVLLDIVKVETRADHILLLDFENGERRLFHMTPYQQRKPYLPLNDPPEFAGAALAYGAVVWPADIDIAPETLYDHSLPP